MNISENFHVFHFDEFPILYAGTNYLGNKIIGSLACEEDDMFRHFSLLISNKQYNDFVKRKVSYRDLILSNQNISIVDKDINGKQLATYYLPTQLLPLDYLPLENVFCPNVERAIGFDYMVSLQGKIADIHEAFSNTVAEVGKSADKILNRIGDALKIKALNAQVFQMPSIEGSFELKFRVKVDYAGLFFQEQLIKRYFQLCLEYSVNTLPGEAKQLATGEISGTSFERDIISSARQVYESFSYKIEEDNIQNFTTNILKNMDEIESISAQVGKGFNTIEFSGFDVENKEVSIGYIDKQYADEIEEINQYIAEIPHKGEILDDSYQEYRILVYDLNIDTRKGTAHISNGVDVDIMDNPKIKIEGEGDLAGSVFTESLHFNKWIIVKAKAKTISGKFKFLNIFFQD
ncbi:hypothetical protein [Spirosoma jeollabukense]